MSVQQGCRVLSVSRSGYYASRLRAITPKLVCATRVRLKALFETFQRTYGSRRLKNELNQKGIKIGRYKVQSLMRESQLKPVWKPKFVNTTDSQHDLPVFENVLNRQFKPQAANQAWVTDITYISTQSG
jgi:putative transposase